MIINCLFVLCDRFRNWFKMKEMKGVKKDMPSEGFCQTFGGHIIMLQLFEVYILYVLIIANQQEMI